MTTLSTTCVAPSCERTPSARGWCNLHYQRFIRWGDIEGHAPTREERFWSRVDRTDGCWNWTATIQNAGYGWTGRDLAHRVSYRMVRGEIPAGMTIDHLCRNRRCANPEHLELVTLAENIRRGDSPSARTARTGICARGHEMTPGNVYIAPGDGSRRCRACVSLREGTRKGQTT